MIRGLEKIILNFINGKSFLLHRKGGFAGDCKFSNKNDLLWTIKNFVIDIDITNDTLSRKFHP